MAARPGGQAAKGIERRQHGRARIHLEATLQGKTPAEQYRLSVSNFSVGGFFCHLNRPIAELTRFGITFVFPPFADHAPRTIDCSALVVRAEPPAAGSDAYKVAACFTQLAADDRDHIQAYVDWYREVHGESGSSADEALL